MPSGLAQSLHLRAGRLHYRFIRCTVRPTPYQPWQDNPQLKMPPVLAVALCHPLDAVNGFLATSLVWGACAFQTGVPTVQSMGPIASTRLGTY